MTSPVIYDFARSENRPATQEDLDVLQVWADMTSELHAVTSAARKEAVEKIAGIYGIWLRPRRDLSQAAQHFAHANYRDAWEAGLKSREDVDLWLDGVMAP